MKRAYTHQQLSNVLDVLRKAGYSYFRDPNTEEESFVLRLTPDYYPRFHLYVKQNEQEVILNLHLDQKKPSYGDNHAHSGEYDGPTVEKEMARIDSWVRAAYRQSRAQVRKDTEKIDTQKRRWWNDGLTKFMKKFFPGDVP